MNKIILTIGGKEQDLNTYQQSQKEAVKLIMASNKQKPILDDRFHKLHKKYLKYKSQMSREDIAYVEERLGN